MLVSSMIDAVPGNGVNQQVERSDDPGPQEHHAHAAPESPAVATSDRLAEYSLGRMSHAIETERGKHEKART